MAAGIQIVGEKELVKRLSRMSAGAQRRMARPAVRQAAAEIRKTAKRLAPVSDLELLKRSISSVVRTGRIGVYAVIGPAWGFKTIINGKPVDPAKYGHLVEFGTAPHKIVPKNAKALLFKGLLRASVEHPGAQAKPFLRPAYDSVPALRIIQNRLRIELDKEAKRSA